MISETKHAAMIICVCALLIHDYVIRRRVVVERDIYLRLVSKREYTNETI